MNFGVGEASPSQGTGVARYPLCGTLPRNAPNEVGIKALGHRCGCNRV